MRATSGCRSADVALRLCECRQTLKVGAKPFGAGPAQVVVGRARKLDLPATEVRGRQRYSCAAAARLSGAGIATPRDVNPARTAGQSRRIEALLRMSPRKVNRLPG